MKPFKQTESAMTKSAKVLAPEENQGYNAVIQQNVVREKINFTIAQLNALRGTL